MFLSPRKSELNILLGMLSTSKFKENQSVLQQISLFFMFSSKEMSLLVSCSKLCLDYLI